jgi:hypothetical protein
LIGTTSELATVSFAFEVLMLDVAPLCMVALGPTCTKPAPALSVTGEVADEGTTEHDRPLTK